MRHAWFTVTFWIRTHSKMLIPFGGAVAMAVKPLALGTDVGPKSILSVAALITAAGVAYVVPNLEGSSAKYAKEVTVLALAGIGAAQNVLPGGISRVDLWTIGTAVVVAALPFLTPTTATRAVQASGDGRMGVTAQ